LSRQGELDEIAKQIAACRVCKRDKIGMPVPGEGSANAKIVFIGEAPGKKEAATGKPFIGPAGKVLRSMLESAGIKDSEVFITSPVKYLPKHVTPTPEEVAHGRIHLHAQLAVIKPKLIVLMGRIACLAMLERDCSIASDHGKIIKSGKWDYFLSYHPAAPLYSPKLRDVLAKDFKKLKRLTSKI
jgi:uracil-DNA glycosylase